MDNIDILAYNYFKVKDDYHIYCFICKLLTNASACLQMSKHCKTCHDKSNIVQLLLLTITANNKCYT